jgi:hypothetical protein
MAKRNGLYIHNNPIISSLVRSRHARYSSVRSKCISSNLIRSKCISSNLIRSQPDRKGVNILKDIDRKTKIDIEI